MGLSNEERKSGLFWAIRRIVEKARELPEYEAEYAHIKSFAEDLWPAYLDGETNGMHWFLGSSATNAVEGENNTSWDTAIADHIEKACKEETEDLFRIIGFDPFEGFLDIPGLLNEPHKSVYLLFTWTEQLTYYLRRYEDSVLRQYSGLSSLVSRIQGECFSCFADEDCFAYAYTADRVCRILYWDLWPEDKRGHTTKWLMKKHVHHEIGSMIRNKEVPLKRLLAIHTDLTRIRPENRGTRRNEIRRLLFAIELAGSHMHYAHQHKGLMKYLKDECKWTSKELGQVSAALAKFCQEKKEKTWKREYIEELFYADPGMMKYEEESKPKKKS